jgi:hypothetical protein
MQIVQTKAMMPYNSCFRSTHAEIGARLLTWCGGGAAAGYVIARQVLNSTRLVWFTHLAPPLAMLVPLDGRSPRVHALQRSCMLSKPV